MYASILLSTIKDVLPKIALIFFDENNNLDVQDRNKAPYIAPVKSRKGQTPASSCTLNYIFLYSPFQQNNTSYFTIISISPLTAWLYHLYEIHFGENSNERSL